MSTQERIGRIGDCYEYSKSGKRLSGTDKMTFDEMLAYSRTWPETYHQHVDSMTSKARWAHNGSECSGHPLDVK